MQTGKCAISSPHAVLLKWNSSFAVIYEYNFPVLPNLPQVLVNNLRSSILNMLQVSSIFLFFFWMLFWWLFVLSKLQLQIILWDVIVINCGVSWTDGLKRSVYCFRRLGMRHLGLGFSCFFLCSLQQAKSYDQLALRSCVLYCWIVSLLLFLKTRVFCPSLKVSYLLKAKFRDNHRLRVSCIDLWIFSFPVIISTALAVLHMGCKLLLSQIM